jgi:phosphoribosylanthranilate isomerase
VRAAIEEVRPQGVDLCSGVRVHGRLSEKRLAGFMRAVVA